MEPVVQFAGAVVLVGRFPALAGVDLLVASGEVVLLRGPNGAGKTTLLRACAGLAELSAGVGRVLGADLRAEPRAVRRQVGLVGHATMLYDELTVSDNLRFWVRAAGVSVERAEPALERLGVERRLWSVPVGRLSAGQRRRVAIAVMAARRPRLWLLDEPHAGLDRDGRALLDGLVAQAAASGATVLVASHELDPASALVSRAVTLAGGAVVHDTAADASTAPTTSPEACGVA
ncbi:MAG: heme ABC exporter ATP-binding protein CcmA [Acidimicrobiales bacterium]